MSASAQNHDRFMNQSYFHATIRDRLRVERLSHQQNYAQPYRGAICSFFKLPSAQIAIHRGKFPPYDSQQIAMAMEECFVDWKIVKRRGERFTTGRPWLASWTRSRPRPANSET